MCATSTSSSAARPVERRRNARLRASSLIYAQLGSDNGGVVVNLGPDGILCQVAHKFISNQDSTITLKIRGSGLNAEMAGNVVWLGTTQKEVGISFKSLPANVKRSIEDWIERESGPAESAKPKQGAPQKSIAEIADMAVPEKKTIPRSLSAALALSRSTSTDPVSSPSQDRSSPDRSGPVKSAASLPAAPNLEIFPTPKDSRIAAETSSVNAEVDSGLDSELDSEDSILRRTALEQHVPDNLVEFPEAEHLTDDSRVLGLPPLGVLKRAFAEARKAIVPEPPEVKKSHDAALPAQPETAKPSGTQGVAQPLPAPLTSPPAPKLRRPSAAKIAEQWIPPAALIAWHRLSVKHRQLLTHVGTVCLGLTIGLLLILLVTSLHGPSNHPAKSVVQQPLPSQRETPTDSPVDASGTDHPFLRQGPPVPPATPASNQEKLPEPSTLSKIASSVFGFGSDGDPKISDYQMGLAVWTSQSSGYYYCSDDPYVKSVQSGVAMLQGDALQAGYRPRLGQFCN